MKRYVSMFLLLALVITAITVYPKKQMVVRADAFGFEDATVVVFDQDYEGVVVAKTYEDSDYKYKLSISEAGLVEIYTKGTPDYIIYDDKGEKLEKVWIGDKPEYDARIYLNVGDYYIRLCGNGKEVDKQFSIKFGFTSSKESFVETKDSTNNDYLLANNISLETTYKGQFMWCGVIADTEDYYKFEVPMKGNVQFTLNVRDLFGNGAPYYQICDADKNVLLNGHIWISETNMASVSCEMEKGTYYLLVKNEVANKYGFPGYAYDFKVDYKPTIKSEIRSVSRKGTKATVKYKKVPGAKSYVVYYSTSKNFTAKTTKSITTSKTTVTLSKLDASKNYYVRVKAVAVSNGKTYSGEMSDKKVIKKAK